MSNHKLIKINNENPLKKQQTIPEMFEAAIAGFDNNIGNGELKYLQN